MMIDSWSALHSFLVPFSNNKGFQNYLKNGKKGDAIADSSCLHFKTVSDFQLIRVICCIDSFVVRNSK